MDSVDFSDIVSSELLEGEFDVPVSNVSSSPFVKINYLERAPTRHFSNEWLGRTKLQTLYRSYSTLLTESELNENHGLKVVGSSHAEQWLVPTSLKEDNPYIQEAVAEWVSAFELRIVALREAADEEAITICEQSVAHARVAADRLHRAFRPSIFLLDGGNIRFVWHGDAGAQVGWQFLESGRIQFVMIDGDGATGDRSYGEAGLDSALRQLHASGFANVVFG
jgi:hypothetical protein